jgi:hypothetical protein
MVNTLCYKPKGRGFKTRWGVFLSIYLFLLAALDPGIHSASNRNEYQEQRNKCFWGIKCGRCEGLTTLPPSVSRLSIQCVILNISQPYRPPRPVTGIALLYFTLKLHGLSPRVNYEYTDRATAACQRSDCQLFADRGCHVVSVMDSYGRILGFLDRSRYFSIK